MNAQQATAWVSDLRFGSFLSATSGDHRRAVLLYMWHARLAAASFETMHHFEVLLRNAIDRRLGTYQPNAPLRNTWLLDQSRLHPRALRQVREAVSRLNAEGKPIERGQVIAALPFGFWRGLFGRRYERLWRGDLSAAFPGARTRKRMTVPLTKLHQFRNRLAHHDSILQVNVSARLDQMVTIASWADPAAGRWLSGTSRISLVLAQKP